LAGCDPCNEQGGVLRANESYTCSATGACELVDCNVNSSSMRANCDGSLSNGCETYLAGDSLNCGACGNACPDTSPPGADGTYCSSGVCRPDCLRGRSDPDGVLDNGCEMTMPFVVGTSCPGGFPAEGSQCDYLAIEGCAYFTPGSPCVTRAHCGFIDLANTPWIVSEEECNGRRAGEFCELDLECSSGKCADNTCLSANGSSCSMDQDCASAVCCPSETEDRYECAPTCVLAGVGAECTWDAQCATGTCSESTCAPCGDADCVAALCGERQCGSVSGVPCGTCLDGTYCQGEGMCVDACADVECGTSHGADCGACTGQDYCNAGQCEDPCATVECGENQGVNCGDCTGTDYCNAGQCEDACVDVECGENQGVDCGTCAGATELCDAGECVDVCTYVECGVYEDIDCGGCSGSTEACQNGVCVDVCADVECGTYDQIDCGSCGVDEACASGSCEPVICPLDQEYYCKDGDVWACDGGTSESLEDDCGDTEFCVEDDETCNPRCATGEAACINGVHGTCAADEVSLEGEMRDCAAESLLCYAPAGCGHLNTSSHASSQCIDSYAFVGNVYEVYGDRYLLNFGMDVSLATTTDVTFSVYAGASENGPFTLAASKTVSSGPGQGVLYAQGITVALTDGQFVVLAVTVGDGFSCHGVAANTSDLSFGRSTGKGYLIAASPGATIGAAPTAVTSYAYISSFWVD